MLAGGEDDVIRNAVLRRGVDLQRDLNVRADESLEVLNNLVAYLACAAT